MAVVVVVVAVVVVVSACRKSEWVDSVSIPERFVGLEEAGWACKIFQPRLPFSVE